MPRWLRFPRARTFVIHACHASCAEYQLTPRLARVENNTIPVERIPSLLSRAFSNKMLRFCISRSVFQTRQFFSERVPTSWNVETGREVSGTIKIETRKNAKILISSWQGTAGQSIVPAFRFVTIDEHLSCFRSALYLCEISQPDIFSITFCDEIHFLWAKISRETIINFY